MKAYLKLINKLTKAKIEGNTDLAEILDKRIKKIDASAVFRSTRSGNYKSKYKTL